MAFAFYGHLPVVDTVMKEKRQIEKQKEGRQTEAERKSKREKNSETESVCMF